MIQFAGPPQEPSADGARFHVGQLVRHRRYGYRGVVVAYDTTCQADDEWYARNQTQPERDQPWYHVLVDGSAQTTYAAQTSLETDPSREPIRHPWLERYFSAFTGTQPADW